MHKFTSLVLAAVLLCGSAWAEDFCRVEQNPAVVGLNLNVDWSLRLGSEYPRNDGYLLLRNLSTGQAFFCSNGRTAVAFARQWYCQQPIGTAGSASLIITPDIPAGDKYIFEVAIAATGGDVLCESDVLVSIRSDPFRIIAGHIIAFYGVPQQLKLTQRSDGDYCYTGVTVELYNNTPDDIMLDTCVLTVKGNFVDISSRDAVVYGSKRTELDTMMCRLGYGVYGDTRCRLSFCPNTTIPAHGSVWFKPEFICKRPLYILTGPLRAEVQFDGAASQCYVCKTGLPINIYWTDSGKALLSE